MECTYSYFPLTSVSKSDEVAQDALGEAVTTVLKEEEPENSEFLVNPTLRLSGWRPRGHPPSWHSSIVPIKWCQIRIAFDCWKRDETSIAPSHQGKGRDQGFDSGNKQKQLSIILGDMNLESLEILLWIISLSYRGQQKDLHGDPNVPVGPSAL